MNITTAITQSLRICLPADRADQAHSAAQLTTTVLADNPSLGIAQQQQTDYSTVPMPITDHTLPNHAVGTDAKHTDMREAADSPEVLLWCAKRLLGI